jgi:HPt (histidine-containing phosphotransfer) domain-containing protein
MYQYINLEYLNELSEGNNEFKKDMILTFLDRVPFYIEEFKELKSSQNWQNMQFFAHKAKSTFQLMGIQKLADDAALIELYCKEGIREKEIEKLLNEMAPYFISVVKEMKKAIKEIE